MGIDLNYITEEEMGIDLNYITDEEMGTDLNYITEEAMEEIVQLNGDNRTIIITTQ